MSRGYGTLSIMSLIAMVTCGHHLSKVTVTVVLLSVPGNVLQEVIIVTWGYNARNFDGLRFTFIINE